MFVDMLYQYCSYLQVQFKKSYSLSPTAYSYEPKNFSTGNLLDCVFMIQLGELNIAGG